MILTQTPPSFLHDVILFTVFFYGGRPLLAISRIALPIRLSLSQFCNDHSYLRHFFNANINDGYLPNSPSAANLLHLLCTDRRSLHNFWFRTLNSRLSQDLNKASLEEKFFLVRMLGNQNSQEYKAIGLIRLSWHELYTSWTNNKREQVGLSRATLEFQL